LKLIIEKNIEHKCETILPKNEFIFIISFRVRFFEILSLHEITSTIGTDWLSFKFFYYIQILKLNGILKENDLTVYVNFICKKRIFLN
jgi:hypothetical protein